MIDRKDREKEKKKKKFFLLLWLFLTILLLSTSTYAWFSTNRITDIEFFDVHIETDGGIEISSNAINWKSVLSVEDITTAHETYPTSTNQVPPQMKPASTAGLVDTNGHLYMYSGGLEGNEEGDFILSATREVEQEWNGEECFGTFISFDVFIRTSVGRKVFLKNSSYVTYVGEESLGIENSARVAFVVEGNLPKGTSVSQIQALNKATNDDVYIWEPNYDVHTASGVENALNNFMMEIPETGAERIKYDGLINPVLLSKNIKMQETNSTYYAEYFKPVNIHIATKKEFENNEELFYLDPGVTKIKIYMWIEGQDVDSENNAAYGDIEYFLQFTLNP